MCLQFSIHSACCAFKRIRSLKNALFFNKCGIFFFDALFSTNNAVILPVHVFFLVNVSFRLYAYDQRGHFVVFVSIDRAFGARSFSALYKGDINQGVFL